MKKLLAILLALVMVIGTMPVLALFGAAEETWTWGVVDGVLTIDGTGTIPSYTGNALDTRPWHSELASVTKIVVKGGITAIGDRAFNTCPNLNEIVLEEGVTSTGFDCFAHSGTITNVYLPTTLTSMAQGGFYGCTVTNVYYDDTSRDFGARCTMGAYNEAITNANWVNDPDWGSSGYMDDAETIFWSFDADTGTLTITGTGAIPQPATKPWQSYVSQITKVVIGEGITEIPGGGLFANISTLDRVEMPDTVTKIGGDAFAYDGTISYLRLSANVTTISQGVLFGSSVTTISCKKDWRAIQQQASIGAYNDSFGSATWIDCEIFGSALSFGKYGTGIENWEGNGDPNLTQILIATPKWDGTYAAALNNAQWTLVIAPADGDYETEPPVTLVAYPRSVYNGGTWSILRFVPALSTDPAGRFVPIKDKHYKITATVTYNGETCTVTGSEEYWITADPVLFDDYVNITWQIEGVTEYVDNIPRGFKPVYHGSAASYTEGTTAYVVNIPETVVADGDATYNITYTATDMTAGTLGLWGSGYENWTGGTGGNQTQLLLCPKDWEGNELTQFNGTTEMQAVDWILTINGVEYTVKPTTHYGATIFRFEPALWENGLCLVPGTYSIGLVIKDAEGTVVFYTTENTTITVAEDFEPTHKFVDVVTEPTATAKGYTTHTCANCGKVVVDTYTVLPGYYLVGVNDDWATLEPAYMFEAIGETGLYVLKGVELPANTEFKVVKTEDGATFTDEDFYPAGSNASVGAAHAYNVYFCPTGDDQNGNWHEGTLRAVYCRDYYLAGTNNEWSETADALTEIENTGVFEITGVTFGAGGEFKITGADGFWYPDNNYVVNEGGVYKVTYDEKYDVITVEAAPAHEAGDVNGDGEVTISDVTALLDYLAASDEAAAAMIASGAVVEDQLNLDGNDTVTISDVTALLDILSGQTADEGE